MNFRDGNSTHSVLTRPVGHQPTASKRRPRVVTLFQCTNQGGMEQVGYDLLDQLNGSIDFRIATPRPFGRGEPRLRQIDPAVRAFDYRGKFGWRTLPEFREHLKHLAQEASGIWVVGTCACSLAASVGLDGRKVLSHHYHHFENRLSPVRWLAFYSGLARQLEAITYPTDFTRREALRIAPWLKRKTHVVPNGYTVHYRGEEERVSACRRARRQLGLDPNGLIVGNAGWLIQRKRFDVFLHTARLIKNARPDARFVICGGGPLELELKELAYRLKLGDAVHFTGWTGNLDLQYQAWDICLFNSDFDTLPCVPLEASSHGVPVVASLRYGGLGEFIDDGVSGRLMNEHRPDELARQVIALAEHPDQARSIRLGAAHKLQERFSADSARKFYETIFS